MHYLCQIPEKSKAFFTFPLQVEDHEADFLFCWMYSVVYWKYNCILIIRDRSQVGIINFSVK